MGFIAIWVEHVWFCQTFFQSSRPRKSKSTDFGEWCAWRIIPGRTFQWLIGPYGSGCPLCKWPWKLAYKWGVYLLTTYNHKPTTSPIRTHLWKIILSLSNSLSLGRGGFGLADFVQQKSPTHQRPGVTFRNQNRFIHPKPFGGFNCWSLGYGDLGEGYSSFFSILCFVFCCVRFFHPRNHRRNVLNVAWNKPSKFQLHSRKKKQLWLIISKRNDSSLPLFFSKTWYPEAQGDFFANGLVHIFREMSPGGLQETLWTVDAFCKFSEIQWYRWSECNWWNHLCGVSWHDFFSLGVGSGKSEYVNRGMPFYPGYLIRRPGQIFIERICKQPLGLVEFYPKCCWLKVRELSTPKMPKRIV